MLFKLLAAPRALVLKMLGLDAVELDRGNLLLRHACEHGDASTVVALLEAGVNANRASALGMTPLMLSSHNARRGSVSHGRVVRALLDSGSADLHAASFSGMSALHFAASSGNVENVALLLAKGASINATCHDGRLALHVAALEGHCQVARLLLLAGSNPNARDNAGATALTLAAHSGCVGAVQSLLAFGASCYVKDSAGDEPYVKAALRGHDGTLRVLLNCGQDENERARQASRALARIVEDENSSPDSIATLLQAGASANTKTSDGATALHGAARRLPATAVQLLLCAGAHVNAISPHGATPWTVASNGGRFESMVTLLKSGADVDAVEANAWLPLLSAALTRAAGLGTGRHLASDRDDDGTVVVAPPAVVAPRGHHHHNNNNTNNDNGHITIDFDDTPGSLPRLTSRRALLPRDSDWGSDHTPTPTLLPDGPQPLPTVSGTRPDSQRHELEAIITPRVAAPVVPMPEWPVLVEVVPTRSRRGLAPHAARATSRTFFERRRLEAELDLGPLGVELDLEPLGVGELHLRPLGVELEDLILPRVGPPAMRVVSGGEDTIYSLVAGMAWAKRRRLVALRNHFLRPDDTP